MVETGPEQFYIAYPGEVNPQQGGRYAEKPYFFLRGEAVNALQLMNEVQGVLEGMIHGESPLTLEMVREEMGKRYEIGHQ